MKINVALIVAIIAAVGLVAFGFTAFQIYTERQQLNQELELKTINTAEKFYNHYFPQGESTDTGKVMISDSVINEYSFAGIAVYYPTDSLVPLNIAASPMVPHSMDYVSQALAADSSMGNMITVNGKKYYQYIKVTQRP